MNTVIYSRLKTDFEAQRWDNTIRVQQRHWSRFLLRNGEQKSNDLGFGCLPESPEQRQQGDGELRSERRACPYWPYREETSPVSTGPPPESDHGTGWPYPGDTIGIWVQTVCWVHGAGAWSSEWGGQGRRSSCPRECGTEGQGAVLLPGNCPFSLHPLLSAAAPGPASLFRDVCADKTPFLRVTSHQDSVTCQVGWWTSGIRHPCLLPGVPAAVWGEKPRTGSTRSLWSRSAGASVALLGGSISEQKGEGKNSPAQDWGEAWSSKPP